MLICGNILLSLLVLNKLKENISIKVNIIATNTNTKSQNLIALNPVLLA